MANDNFQITEDISLIIGWGTRPPNGDLYEMVAVFAAALQTTVAKDKLYGGAWKDQGWMGNLARILSKTARLKQMLWRDKVLEDSKEPVTDTLLDLINLCTFALVNRKRGNAWGRGAGE